MPLNICEKYGACSRRAPDHQESTSIGESTRSNCRASKSDSNSNNPCRRNTRASFCTRNTRTSPTGVYSKNGYRISPKKATTASSCRRAVSTGASCTTTVNLAKKTKIIQCGRSYRVTSDVSNSSSGCSSASACKRVETSCSRSNADSCTDSNSRSSCHREHLKETSDNVGSASHCSRSNTKRVSCSTNYRQGCASRSVNQCGSKEFPIRHSCVSGNAACRRREPPASHDDCQDATYSTKCLDKSSDKCVSFCTKNVDGRLKEQKANRCVMRSSSPSASRSCRAGCMPKPYTTENDTRRTDLCSITVNPDSQPQRPKCMTSFIVRSYDPQASNTLSGSKTSSGQVFICSAPVPLAYRTSASTDKNTVNRPQNSTDAKDNTGGKDKNTDVSDVQYVIPDIRTKDMDNSLEKEGQSMPSTGKSSRRLQVPCYTDKQRVTVTNYITSSFVVPTRRKDSCSPRALTVLSKDAKQTLKDTDVGEAHGHVVVNKTRAEPFTEISNTGSEYGSCQVLDKVHEGRECIGNESVLPVSKDCEDDSRNKAQRLDIVSTNGESECTSESDRKDELSFLTTGKSFQSCQTETDLIDLTELSLGENREDRNQTESENNNPLSDDNHSNAVDFRAAFAENNKGVDWLLGIDSDTSHINDLLTKCHGNASHYQTIWASPATATIPPFGNEPDGRMPHESTSYPLFDLEMGGAVQTTRNRVAQLCENTNTSSHYSEANKGESTQLRQELTSDEGTTSLNPAEEVADKMTMSLPDTIHSDGTTERNFSSIGWNVPETTESLQWDHGGGSIGPHVESNSGSSLTSTIVEFQ